MAVSTQTPDEVLAAQRRVGLDSALFNAEEQAHLPGPTVLVVDEDHTLRLVDVQPDYTARIEIADIVTALHDLT